MANNQQRDVSDQHAVRPRVRHHARVQRAARACVGTPGRKPETRQKLVGLQRIEGDILRNRPAR